MNPSLFLKHFYICLLIPFIFNPFGFAQGKYLIFGRMDSRPRLRGGDIPSRE